MFPIRGDFPFNEKYNITIIFLNNAFAWLLLKSSACCHHWSEGQSVNHKHFSSYRTQQMPNAQQMSISSNSNTNMKQIKATKQHVAPNGNCFLIF